MGIRATHRRHKTHASSGAVAYSGAPFLDRKSWCRVVAATVALIPFTLANAQSLDASQSALLLSDDSPAADVRTEARSLVPVIRIERFSGAKDMQGLYGEETMDVNLGVEFTPVEGLSLTADAWKLESRDVPIQSSMPTAGWQPQIPTYDGAGAGNFIFDQPFVGNGIDSQGIDVGASYVWNTATAGTFTVSTSATYIQEFEQRNLLTEGLTPLDQDATLPGAADLQGSLTLTWQFGNHSASAVTNYFDSIDDISELNIDEINKLVESITTVDLQYGYNVKTGKQDRGVISFSLGIRNIFDKKTTQILNHKQPCSRSERSRSVRFDQVSILKLLM